jgi:hypothetical protein
LRCMPKAPPPARLHISLLPPRLRQDSLSPPLRWGGVDGQLSSNPRLLSQEHIPHWKERFGGASATPA